MSSIFGFGQDDAGDGNEEPAPPTAPPPTSEDLRRMRLEKMEAVAASSPPPAATAAIAASATSSIAAPAAVPIAQTSPPKAPSIAALGVSPMLPSPDRRNRDQRVLNSALEETFQMSVRDNSASSSMRDMSAFSEDDHLSNKNISTLIVMRLSEGAERGGAVGYLANCHCRLAVKESSSASDYLRESLVDCRKQVVSFLASALSEKDIFDENSTNSTSDFVAWLLERQCLNIAVLKEILDELEKEGTLDNVCVDLVQQAMLHSESLSASVADDVSSALLLLVTLCKVDKRLARKFTQHPSFLVEENKRTAKPPRLTMPLHFMTPQMQSSMRVQGAALEALTPLGRMLRVSADFQNPKNHEFFRDCHKMSRQIGEGKVKQLRDGLMRVQNSAHETLLALLKASKEDTLAWMRQSLQLNVEAAKDQPNRLAAASPGMLLNLGSVMLRLCRPFLSDPAKLSKVDWAFLASAEGLATFPTDDMRLLQLTEDERARLLASGDAGAAGKEFNFISQSFFFCWRALHIGVVSEVDQYRNIVRRLSHYSAGLATGDPNSVQALTFKLLADVYMMSPDLVKDLLEFTEGACASLMAQLEGPAGSGKEPASSSSSGDDWMLPRSSCPPAVLRLLTTIPEHLITDVMEILLFVAKTQPTQLCTSRLDSVLSLTVYFLRRPWAVTSPHLRAKFGQVLYYIFLPVANMPGEERWSGEAPRDGNHSSLLGTLVTAQNNLAPALLLLYGDVEKTGYYEKLTHRRHIMVVLKHLWMLPTHRSAFRGIAKSSSGAGEEGADGQDEGAEVSYFIRFANGLLNETNSLVAQTVELLGDIRTSDAIRSDASVWGSMNEEARETHQSRFGEAEQQVAGAAGLCLETLDFMSFLCSDEEIRMPFLIDEILQRFVSMLTNVLSRFTGSKSMELKVAPERWAQYKFNPKQMLMRVCQTMGYFKEFAPFCDAMAKDGFYGDGTPLKKAIGTVLKYNMLTPVEVASLTELLERTEKAQKASLDLETLLDDAPDEFLDPLLLTLMRDPVKLPTSGNTVDRSTIATQLLNNELDPFNRQPLQLKDVVPDLELKTKIDEWLRSKGVEP